MAFTLTFDSERFIKAYTDYVSEIAFELALETAEEIRTRSSSSKAPEEVNAMAVEIINNEIIATVKSGINVILKSYGTGSKMDKTNPFLEKYEESQYWNTLRDKTTKAVYGRKYGEYTNIFDEKKFSSGSFQGQNLEETSDYKPIIPDNSIKNSEKIIFTSRINMRLDEKTKTWIEKNAPRFFSTKKL